MLKNDKTYVVKASDIKREWHLIDASDKVLGRLATEAARLLMGKHKTLFCRNLDIGDYVVVTNAEKVKITGQKATKKLYYRHSGYPGGFKSTNLGKMMQEHPTRVVEYAVRGMLPYNRLRDRMMTRLKICVGDDNPYQGQVKVASTQPEAKE